MIDGLPYANILERILALDVRIQQLVARLIEAEEHDPVFRPTRHLGSFVLFDTPHVLWRRVQDEIDLARQQCSRACCIGADLRVDHFGHISLAAAVFQAPPVGIALQHGAYAGLTSGEDPGAGPVGVTGRKSFFLRLEVERALDLVLGRPRLAHDVNRRRVLERDRIRLVLHELDGEVIDLARLANRDCILP